jgi:glutamine cyclotransferase
MRDRLMFVRFTSGLAVAWSLTVVLVLSGCSSSTSPDGAATVEADVDVAPAAGTVITDFAFDASGSNVGARALEYRWDWENDGVWDTDWSTDAMATHRFETAAVTVAVGVTDGSDSDKAVATAAVDVRHGEMVGTFACPIPMLKALDYHDGYLWGSVWLLNSNPGRLYRIDPATGDTVESMHAPSNWPCGIAWDGTSLWVTDHSGNMKMFEMDPSDGTVLSSFDIEYSVSSGGLAWDGEYLYYGNTTDEKIYKYTRNGTLDSYLEPPLPGRAPKGVAYDGEHLWVALSFVDTLYVMDKDTGDVLRRIYLDDRYLDLAVDGEHVWSYMSAGGYNLAKIVP